MQGFGRVRRPAEHPLEFSNDVHFFFAPAGLIRLAAVFADQRVVVQQRLAAGFVLFVLGCVGEHGSNLEGTLKFRTLHQRGQIVNVHCLRVA